MGANVQDAISSDVRTGSDVISSRVQQCGTLSRESAACQNRCSRRTSELYTLAMEMCGGVASLDEFGLIRHDRDLFVCRVGEGSNFALKTLATKPLMPTIANLLQ